MNIEDVKQISIADYLHSLGYSPVKRQGNSLWYKSPLREEHEASFKVNTDRNLWYDFGAGKGGNIIALAKRECKELHFTNNGRPFFAIGFPNIAGGYEIRNSFFKGCIAPKDITHIRQQGEPRDTCFVFEGFLDFLSFLTIRQQKSPDMPCTDWQDYVILNSTANTDKALYPLADYGHIHCMLDNDEAGRKAVEAIRQEYKWRVRDASHLYSGHNDLNDYLRSLKVKQSQDLTVTDKPQPEQDNRQNPGEKRKRGLRM